MRVADILRDVGITANSAPERIAAVRTSLVALPANTSFVLDS